MTIGNFLNSPSEEEDVEDFNEEEAPFEGVAEEPFDGNTEEDETEMAKPRFSLKKQLRVLATAKRILSSSDSTKFITLRAIADVQALLWRDVPASSWQTLIKDYYTGDQSTRVL